GAADAPAGVAIGDVAVGWDPAAGVWQLVRGGEVVATAAGAAPSSTDWLFVAQPHGAAFPLDGRQIPAHRFAEPVGGALVLTAGGDGEGFSRLIVFHRPALTTTYTDGVGNQRQWQTLDGGSSPEGGGLTVGGGLLDDL